MVGAGIVGLACAWLLQRRGHAVLLLDPNPPRTAIPGADAPAAEESAASRAALGILMGHVFHRSSGRGWRLRRRGLHLWDAWRRELTGRGHPIPWRPGLLLLAADDVDLQRQRRLLATRQRQGLTLESWEPERLAGLQPDLPFGALGGLYSAADGQLDPGSAMEALARDAKRWGVERLAEGVKALEPLSREAHPRGPGSERASGGWRAHLGGGGKVEGEWVVLAAGLGSGELLAPLGHEWPMEPMLGQALELELPPEGLAGPGLPSAQAWPGAVVWRGVNLVPRPDLAQGRGFWLGATLETGRMADSSALRELRDLGGAAPPWLRGARVLRQWQGLRPRPLQRPAPQLELIAPGLLLASGHYRNGVLLAPASAEWVLEQIEAEP